eukprot:5992400-Pyramimonas_sp.AAC.1
MLRAFLEREASLTEAVPLRVAAAAGSSICTFFQRFLFILVIWMAPPLRTVSGGVVLPQKPFVFRPRVQ